MKKLLILLVFIPLMSFGQNITKLETLNGFRELKLGSDISNYNFVEKANSQNIYYNWEYKIGGNVYYTSSTFSGSDSDYPDSELYVVKKGTSNYTQMPSGDKIEKIFIQTFEGKIYQIKIIVPHRPSSHIYLLKSYRDVFGKPNFIDGYDAINFEKEAENNEKYWDVWSGKNIQLSIISLEDSQEWRGTKRRFYMVNYSELGEINNQLHKIKKRRDSIKKQKMIDDF